MRLGLAVAAKGECDPTAFLQALDADPAFAGSDVEVHIAHDRPWSPSIGVSPGNIRRHACPPGSSAFRLWGVAIARASAEYVAVLDIQMPPAAGWLARVRAEIARGTPLFFGPVECGWDPRDRRVVGYLAEYAQFASPLPAKLREVPGNNLVGRRSLLVGADDVAPGGFFKTFVIWRLMREHGIAPCRFDDMPVVYRKDFVLAPYLSTRLVQGRTFAVRRHEHPGQPARLLCIGCAPLLPLLRLRRILAAARRRRRAVMRHLPLLLLSEAAWSLGEFLGYAGRRGSSND